MGYTSYLYRNLKKAEKKDPLKTKEAFTTLHNEEARRQEHDALKREQGLPEEQDPNAMRYQRYSEAETDEQGKIMHNKPPWVVNEASEMIAEINDEDAPSYKKSDKAQNRAGKNTASLTKTLFNSEGQNYGGVIAPERYEIVEKGHEPGHDDAPKSPNTEVTRTVKNPKTGLLETHTGRYDPNTGDLLEGAVPFNAPETPEEKAKRKSGTGLAPTSTQMPDDWRNPEQQGGRDTDGRKTYELPEIDRRKIKPDEIEDMEKGIVDDLKQDAQTMKSNAGWWKDKLLGRKKAPQDRQTYVNPDTGARPTQSANKELTERITRSPEFAARRAAQHGGLASDWEQGTETPPASPETQQRLKDAGLDYARKQMKMGKLTKALSKLIKANDADLPEFLRDKSEDFKNKESIEAMNAKTREKIEAMKAKRGGGKKANGTPADLPDFLQDKADMEKGAGSDRSMGWKKRNTRAKDIGKDPTMAIRREEPEYDPEGGAGQMTRSPGDVKGEGDKKKQEMITNYIRSLNKANGFPAMSTVRDIDPEDEERIEAQGVHGFVPKYDRSTGKEKIKGRDVSDEEIASWPTEKAGMGSGGHARQQQRQFNQMTSAQKKRYGGMGMGMMPQQKPLKGGHKK